jgi:integrase
MVAAMVLDGLRRCEVLGLRLEDLRVAERRGVRRRGQGSRRRLVPVSRRFFEHVAAYLESARPADSMTDSVVLKGPRRRQPLTVAGLDDLLDAARGRAGLRHTTCRELRNTCLIRLSNERNCI